MYTGKLLPTHIYGLMYICSSKKVDNIVCFGSNPATTRVFYGKILKRWYTVLPSPAKEYQSHVKYARIHVNCARIRDTVSHFAVRSLPSQAALVTRKSMKTTTIKAEQLARLRALRDDIVRRTGYEKAERLRKAREAEAISNYWLVYASTTKRVGRGAR